MTDLEGLKTSIDLIVLVGCDTELKHVASSGGGEYAGSCPFCGGTDRFRVQPATWRWMCRNCTAGKWQDCFAYVMKRDNVDFKTALQILGGSSWRQPGRHIPPPPPQPADQPPGDDWQRAALEVVEVCAARLWQPESIKALDWLKNKRGLTEATIKRWKLGVSPGEEIAGLRVYRGITIPCIVAGAVWYVKVRISPELIKDGWDKYLCVKGSHPKALYGGDGLSGNMALFCEGEFDCMLANQEIGDTIPAVTFGSATNLPDLATWGAYFLKIEAALLAYDLDPAGEAGEQRVINLLGERAKLALLPSGTWKDITDFHQAGGNLAEWIKPYLEFYEVELSV